MMTENALEGCNGPVSQTIASVKALLQWKKISTDPLPADVSLDNGRLILILSNKKDVYYTCTSIKCSCPANTYNPGQHCKHQRKYFPQPKMEVAEPSSIRPEGKWSGGLNGPVDECKGTAQMPRSPFWWIADPDTRADLRYDLAREERDIAELEDPSEGPQPW